MFVHLLNFTYNIPFHSGTESWHSPLDHFVVFSKLVQRYCLSHLKSEQAWIILPTFGYNTIPVFNSYSPCPFYWATDVLNIQLSPINFWVNHHMNFTNSMSPPASIVKNWSFSAMHFILALLRKALVICRPTHLPTISTHCGITPFSSLYAWHSNILLSL